MKLPEGIADNLQFLCLEIDSQLHRLQTYFEKPSTADAGQLLDRSGYALNLKLRIHDSCLNHLACNEVGDADIATLRGVEFVATQLEHIAELCRDTVRQAEKVIDTDVLSAKIYGRMLGRVRGGISLMEPALIDSDTQTALKISQIKDKLDRTCNKLSQRTIAALKKKSNTEDHAHALFIAHSFERMGDALRESGEAILTATLGQPMTLERHHSLQTSATLFGDPDPVAELQLQSIAETRSGSNISALSLTGDSKQRKDYVAIVKDGTKRKLKEERQGVRHWHKKYPGLAPRILSYKKHGRSATLLIEHLPGLTFEQILLHESPGLLAETFRQLVETLTSVWQETRSDRVQSALFMKQLEKRLDEVYKIHPEFRHDNSKICGLKIRGFDQLLAKASAYETQLTAPFSVYIHGDFNIDNIIYSIDEKRINFIDLHRSRYFDYVQDVSVFMVSNYRLQILDAPLRRRIMQLARDFYLFSRQFADQAGDKTFEIRLALGLARSFATSTRFILDKSLARSMFLRSRYLIEQVLAVPIKQAHRYRVPVEEIFIG